MLQCLMKPQISDIGWFADHLVLANDNICTPLDANLRNLPNLSDPTIKDKIYAILPASSDRII